MNTMMIAFYGLIVKDGRMIVEGLLIATAVPGKESILILGITDLSDANSQFTFPLLHADCNAPTLTWEDKPIHFANLLVPYSN
jgi:hypothetical protein